MYIESSFPRRNGDNARLTSPVVSVSGQTTKCLTFWYHMYGPHVDTLNVYANTTTLGPAIWSRNKTQGNAWKLAKVEITKNQSYSVGTVFLFMSSAEKWNVSMFLFEHLFCKPLQLLFLENLLITLLFLVQLLLSACQ